MTSFPADPPTPPRPPSKEEVEQAASDAGTAAKEAVEEAVEDAQDGPPEPPDPSAVDIEGTDPLGGRHRLHADRDLAGNEQLSYEGTDPTGSSRVRVSKDKDAESGNEEEAVEFDSPNVGFKTERLTPGDGAADDSLHPDSHLRINVPSPDGGEDLLDFNTRTEGTLDSEGSSGVSMTPGDGFVTETHVDTPFTDPLDREFRIDTVEGDEGTEPSNPGADTGLGGPDTATRFLDADETLAEIDDPTDFDLA